ncbi:MAG: WecB/TagA/CpsF family glycosyltransferase [Rikenellaceae bacterium]
MFRIKNLNLIAHKSDLVLLPEGKLLINTINSRSYNTAQYDEFYAEALLKGDVLIADGISVAKTYNFFNRKSIDRVAGADLFEVEMDKLNKRGGTCFFLGSSEETLQQIKKKGAEVYPNIKIETYSPPYKTEFSDEENRAMIDAVNNAHPDLLWIGMTAPKQEKWAYRHLNELNIDCHIGTIGAVFDFFAGNIKRAPIGWQKSGFEWLYRFTRDPKKLWKRTLQCVPLFSWNVLREMLSKE